MTLSKILRTINCSYSLLLISKIILKKRKTSRKIKLKFFFIKKECEPTAQLVFISVYLLLIGLISLTNIVVSHSVSFSLQKPGGKTNKICVYTSMPTGHLKKF